MLHCNVCAQIRVYSKWRQQKETAIWICTLWVVTNVQCSVRALLWWAFAVVVVAGAAVVIAAVFCLCYWFQFSFRRLLLNICECTERLCVFGTCTKRRRFSLLHFYTTSRNSYICGVRVYIFSLLFVIWDFVIFVVHEKTNEKESEREIFNRDAFNFLL